MKSWRIITVLLLCLALASSTACNLFGDDEETTWQLVEVVRGDLTVSVSGSGNLDVSNEVKLPFGIGGKVDKMDVEENDEVSKGDVLAELDTGALELALTQAQLALAQAQAALNEGRYDVDYLGRRHAPLEQQRIAKLQVKAAEVQLEAAEQSVAEAEKQLGWTTITAPFDGIVVSVDADEGDTVLATETIIHLIDPATIELNAEVDEIDIPEVKLNQRAIIEVDALPDIQLEGWVISICPLSTEEGGVVVYEVKIGFNALGDFELKIGMSATADIIIQQRSNVLLVPNRAIKQDSQDNLVVEIMVNEESEERQERPVITGISDGYQTEIVSGLQERDVVVIEKRVKKEPGGLF